MLFLVQNTHSTRESLNETFTNIWTHRKCQIDEWKDSIKKLNFNNHIFIIL